MLGRFQGTAGHSTAFVDLRGGFVMVIFCLIKLKSKHGYDKRYQLRYIHKQNSLVEIYLFPNYAHERMKFWFAWGISLEEVHLVLRTSFKIGKFLN